MSPKSMQFQMPHRKNSSKIALGNYIKYPYFPHKNIFFSISILLPVCFSSITVKAFYEIAIYSTIFRYRIGRILCKHTAIHVIKIVSSTSFNVFGLPVISNSYFSRFLFFFCPFILIDMSINNL